MGDSAGTLPAAAEPDSTSTKLIESITSPKNSCLSMQTLDWKSSYCRSEADTDATASGLKKETVLDFLISTESLEDFDGSMLYPLPAEASTLSDHLRPFDSNFIKIDSECDEPVSCHRSRSEVGKPLLLVASSSSSRFEDGYEKQSMMGAGLANLFNTCFFNAVLQCFTHSVLLVQGLYSHTHPTPCDCSNERFCLICALREHIERSLSPTAKVVFPWKFIDNLSYFSSSFHRYQQEDAHEFLQCFLDKLESSLSDLKTKYDGLSSQTDNLVKQVFEGRVISKLRCCNCDHISDTYEPFADLSLEIKDVNSLSTALESFTKVEHIEDEEMKFTCDRCKQKVSVDKQLMLDQIPLICALHLKRFKNDGSYVEKIDKHVEFPLELDLQPYTCGSKSNNVDLKYELYAVVVHEALTSSCGHYYCYIRPSPDTWYKFDDSKVASVSEACVLSEEAYILFYAKKGTPWFSKFMETYKPSFTPNLSTTSPKSVLENVDSPNIQSHDINASKDHPTRSADVAPLKPIVNILKQSSPLIFKEYGSYHKIEVQKNTCFTPTNDSRTKFNLIDEVSPPSTPIYPAFDISDDDVSEEVFAARPEQLKLEEKATCKRQRNNIVQSSVKHEAMKMCKRMPGARGALLMAAMSPKSDNSLSKKSMKMTSPRTNSSKSNDRFNSVNRKRGPSSFR